MKKKTKKALVLMIAILIVLIIIIIILAATNDPVLETSELGQTVIAEQAEEKATETAVAAEPETTEPTSVDIANEKPVRLYVGGSGVMELVTEYDSVWSTDADIAIFEAINSDEDTIYYDDYYTLHADYWNSVATDTQYKIGYELSFDVNGESKVYTILKPADISDNPDLFMGDADNDEVTGYMGVWVYCDIGQTGTYIHLTQEEMQDDTLMTSIKLRPTPQSSEISNLKLKAFSYSSDEEFDSEGHYIGTHGYEIAVNNQ